jgi:hypothetical protein
MSKKPCSRLPKRLEQQISTRPADLNSALTQIKSLVRAPRQMMEEQKETIQAAQQDLQRLYEWVELTREAVPNTGTA